MEAHQDSLQSGYQRLSDEYEELQSVVEALQEEKTDVQESCETQVAMAHADFQKYRVHFCQRLRDLRYELEGELGAQCLPYPEKGTPIGDVVTWFEGEVKSLPGTFVQANKNFVAFAIAGVLRMLQESGCDHLPRLNPLVSSSHASLLDDIPTKVEKLVGRLMCRWWSEHGLSKLHVACGKSLKW
jgi:hypothetical protein